MYFLEIMLLGKLLIKKGNCCSKAWLCLYCKKWSYDWVTILASQAASRAGSGVVKGREVIMVTPVAGSQGTKMFVKWPWIFDLVLDYLNRMLVKFKDLIIISADLDHLTIQFCSAWLIACLMYIKICVLSNARNNYTNITLQPRRWI